ncbi:ribosomal protein S21 [Leptospira alstonii serovar Pingchang str. 80-412]|nr:ribosomal protein S21 [Leptospira alstonii serovar Sichuan str. 79601]EQA81484.1 ribosomal protein S21 [Leptospira alstonii serovar Pingchang str. 80-412]
MVCNFISKRNRLENGNKTKESKNRMVGIIVKDGESIESALKRFKRDCANAGIMSEIKRREYFEKPSIKKKKAIESAKRKAEKKKRLFSKKDKA